MPVAKICANGTSIATKSEEGNDLLDNFIRQAVGKEPLLPFSRTADNPVHWIQLLHALDQPDLPGWPLLTPLKVQMQKCEKCPREFCSPINYRRHNRVHRRSLNLKKESQKIRELLAAFWDKLSLDEVKEVVSFDNVMLKEIPGSSVVRSLASSLRKPAVWTLPQVYMRAGSALLDVIQANPSRLPVSSKELFSILDDASERTFLCAGTADSVQKYVFDGETAKNSLELKNLVATCSFLFEQLLVKAWLADKDAEALRCQKLLVEEEEAAQKRQAAILEKKRQKKLHQKEQKVREQFNALIGDLDVFADGAAAHRSASPDASGPSTPSDSGLNSPDVQTNLDSGPEFVQPQNKESDKDDKDTEPQISSASEHLNQEDAQINEHQMAAKGPRHYPTTSRWQGPKLQRGGRHGFRPTQNLVPKPEALHKLNQTKGQNATNGTKVWTKKIEADSDANITKPPSVQSETSLKTDENNCEVIIGSIPVTLKTALEWHDSSPGESGDNICSPQHAMPAKKKSSEKLIKLHTAQSGSKQKLWRPVSRGETKSTSPVHNSNTESEGVTMLEKVSDRILSSQASMQSPSPEDRSHNNQPQHHVHSGIIPFTSAAAKELKEFLDKRWKEALASEHVVLVLPPSEHEPPGSNPHLENSTASDEPDLHEQVNILDNAAENPPGRNSQVKFRKKPEKNVKTKYIPKQKCHSLE